MSKIYVLPTFLISYLFKSELNIQYPVTTQFTLLFVKLAKGAEKKEKGLVFFFLIISKVMKEKYLKITSQESKVSLS